NYFSATEANRLAAGDTYRQLQFHSKRVGQAQRMYLSALGALLMFQKLMPVPAEAEVVTDAGNGKVLAYLNAHAEVYRQEFRDETNEVVVRCHLPRHLLHHIAGPTVKVRFLERERPAKEPPALGEAV
ncbi:MAG TPA: hypothetical protein VM597_36870, partial [Gemmataceae bacterium]|nr:hypothetical protein [Gemmataceae bacterium]